MIFKSPLTFLKIFFFCSSVFCCFKVYTTQTVPSFNHDLTLLNLSYGIKNIHVSFYHGLALMENGKIYVWGYNGFEQMGLGHDEYQSAPTELSFFNDKNSTQVSCGRKHCLVLTRDGRVYGVGDSYMIFRDENKDRTPTQIDFLLPTAIREIYESFWDIFVLTKDGRIFVKSSREYGQVDIDKEQSQTFLKEVPFPNGDQVSHIEIGGGNIFALTKEGRVYSWGSNRYGRLGHGDRDDRNSPQEILFFKDTKKVLQVLSSESHTLALTEEGRVYSWGSNRYGQLGLGDRDDRNSPQEILFFKDKIVKKLAINSEKSFALTESGELYAWGDNKFGELGLGDRETRILPEKMMFFADNIIKNIGAHLQSITFAITQNGKVFIWGPNNVGQKGLGRSYENLFNAPWDFLFEEMKNRMTILSTSHDIYKSIRAEITLELTQEIKEYQQGRNAEEKME